jgi:hypothetical protein
LATGILTNDELQSGLWSFANALIEQLLDRVAGFNLLTVFALPVREGSVPGLNIALAENLNNMNDLDQ